MKAFLISGIGADGRMFSMLKLPDCYELEWIVWKLPGQHETVSEYAVRLLENRDVSQPFIIIGISFGGILAVEMAKKYSTAITIIISSIPLSAQLPKFYGIVGSMGMNKIVPAYLFKCLTLIKQQLAVKSTINKKLIGEVIMDCDELVIKWGLKAILTWENTTIPKKFFHIHGRKDSVFPIKKTNPTHCIEGGHLLILSASEEINRIIGQILQPEAVIS